MRILKALMNKLLALNSRGVSLTSRRVGHYGFRIGIVLVLLNVAETIADGRGWIPGPADFMWDWGYLAVVLYIGLAIFEHNVRLCEPCISEMPLDGSERAHKHRASLATFHWMADGIVRFYLIWMGLVLAGSLAKKAGLINETVQVAVFAVPTLWVFLSMFRHSQLAVWCPKCRRGGGGGRIVMPEPDPAVSR